MRIQWSDSFCSVSRLDRRANNSVMVITEGLILLEEGGQGLF